MQEKGSDTSWWVGVDREHFAKAVEDAKKSRRRVRDEDDEEWIP